MKFELSEWKKNSKKIILAFEVWGDHAHIIYCTFFPLEKIQKLSRYLQSQSTKFIVHVPNFFKTVLKHMFYVLGFSHTN